MRKTKLTKQGLPRKNKPGAGRPRIELCEAQVLKLSRLRLSQQEMADFFNVSVDTLVNNFSGAMQRGESSGKISLRRAQFISAVKDRNPSMLIWLGKQWLDQSDKFDVGDPGDGEGFSFSFKKAKSE